MRGCVDPREKSVIFPGLPGFLKQAQDSTFPHGGAALISEPRPISGKRIWLGSTSCGVVVSAREDIVIVPAFWGL